MVVRCKHATTRKQPDESKFFIADKKRDLCRSEGPSGFVLTVIEYNPRRCDPDSVADLRYRRAIVRYVPKADHSLRRRSKLSAAATFEEVRLSSWIIRFQTSRKEQYFGLYRSQSLPTPLVRWQPKGRGDRRNARMLTNCCMIRRVHYRCPLWVKADIASRPRHNNKRWAAPGLARRT